ncbi:MAG TPA: hypothetical protein VIH85_22590 [Solirubrobacteraceae bacterium]|jgi:hypothetical protein
MSSSGDIELLRADARDCHDQVALLRAKLYRWGLEPSARLQELERELTRAQERLRDATVGTKKV